MASPSPSPQHNTYIDIEADIAHLDIQLSKSREDMEDRLEGMRRSMHNLSNRMAPQESKDAEAKQIDGNGKEGFGRRFSKTKEAIKTWYNNRYVVAEEDLSLFAVLKDMLHGFWKPARVSREHLLWADLFFAAVLCLFFAFMRDNPPSALTRNVGEVNFQMPYLSMCFQAESEMSVTSTWYDPQDKPISVTPFSGDVYVAEIANSSLTCFLVYGENADLSLQIRQVKFVLDGLVYVWAILFASSSDPSRNFAVLNDSSTTATWWYLTTEEQSAIVTKQNIRSLHTSRNNLYASYGHSTKYSVTPNYIFGFTSNASYIIDPIIYLVMIADPLGVSYYKESDPVNVGSLVGSIGGSFNFVVLAFSVVFGFSIARKWERAQEKYYQEMMIE